MAPVRKIEKATLEKHKVHGEVDGTYTTFQCGGGKHYFQIDTYGSPERKLKGKKSQTIQLDDGAARNLIWLLKAEFPID